MTKEKRSKKIRKVVIQEILRFLSFSIVAIIISIIAASVLPLGIYWFWLNKTQSDSLYLLCYEIIFGTFWVSVAFYFGLNKIKKCYFRKLNILDKRVRSIHLLYEVSSMKIEDLN